jgi:hypothetical protein
MFYSLCFPLSVLLYSSLLSFERDYGNVSLANGRVAYESAVRAISWTKPRALCMKKGFLVISMSVRGQWERLVSLTTDG